MLIVPSEFTHGGKPKGCAIFASELLGGMVFLRERQLAGTAIQEYDPSESFSRIRNTDDLILIHSIPCENVEFYPFCLPMHLRSCSWFPPMPPGESPTTEDFEGKVCS